MNALTQYLDLYRSHRATVEANSPAALNAGREAAFRRLEAAGRLPERGDEGYAAVSVNEMFAPDYGMNIERRSLGNLPGRLSACAIPGGAIPTVMLVNDTYYRPQGMDLPAGVTVMSLAEAAGKGLYTPGVDGAIPADNAVAALNDLFVQDGVYIRVDRGVRIEKPLRVLSVFAAGMPLLATRRIHIEMEADSALTVLVCDHPGAQQHDCLSDRVVEIAAGERSECNFYDLEESPANCSRASVTGIVQSEGSHVTATAISLGGAVSRNDFFVKYAGEHCRTDLGGLVIGGGERVADFNTRITHAMPRCASRQLFKYALFDTARGAFEGLVRVCPGAVYTDAQQSNRNLLASENARMHAEPQLIINCDEVKASHGSATGNLDENAVFYMRSRGIPEEEARMMLIVAFMTDVLETIAHEPLRENLRHIVDKRLRGCAAECDSCGVGAKRQQ